MNVKTVLRRSAEFYGGMPAILCAGRQYTYGECWRRGIRLANGLRRMGASVGDRIAILDRNSICSVDFYLASAIGNFVRVPLYWRNSGALHVQMMTKTRCRFAIAAGNDFAGLSGAESKVPSLQSVMELCDTSYEEWLSEQSDDEPEPLINEDDLCIIRFTGGSSGVPKGVPNTHRQWISVGRDEVSFKPSICVKDTMLHTAPLSHASGYYFLPAWSQGARQVLMSGGSPADILRTMGDEKVNHAFTPPTLLNMLIHSDNVYDYDWSSLKTLAIGSSPIRTNTLMKAAEIFGRHVLYQTYGTSEAVPIAGMGPEEWFAELDGSEPLKAAGRPLPFVDVEIKSTEGTVLPTNHVGEIVVRCDGQMSEYYNDPDESAEKVVDGWIRTGDLGRIDRNGYLYLIGRIGDTIISGGHNIYPSELERIISEHPDVLEVCVFGVPDEKWGETPIAICQVRDNARVSGGEITSMIVDRLGSYMKPRCVSVVLDSLPKSAVGKISRRKIRDNYLKDTTIL